ncbi:MAG TPA: hypothetical protein VHW23_14995 [Kofleriaceae bacterium]|jgi:hypothetical protein|nr:hypothetical protein [Kofleriaceae bacterium]
MKAASTQWQETIGADEETRFQRYGQQLVELQRRVGGTGRALHRNQRLGLRATFEVLGDLPSHARHGLFATPRRHDAQIRLSNGSGMHQADHKPDVRGFAVRVLGVEGPGALGSTTHAQCLLFINSAAFAFSTAEAFMGVVVAAARGPLPLLGHLFKQHGVLGALKYARELARGLGKPFAGFARETFHSAAPIACGPYAVKLRLVPVGDGGPPARRGDWTHDLIARLARDELRWDLQLQFFVDAATTPIEDSTVVWPESESPFVTVARLVAPAQDPNSADGQALAQQIEAGKFDPWVALAEHRPLGEIMRARKAAYFASQQARGAVD